MPTHAASWQRAASSRPLGRDQAPSRSRYRNPRSVLPDRGVADPRSDRALRRARRPVTRRRARHGATVRLRAAARRLPRPQSATIGRSGAGRSNSGPRRAACQPRLRGRRARRRLGFGSCAWRSSVRRVCRHGPGVGAAPGPPVTPCHAAPVRPACDYAEEHDVPLDRRLAVFRAELDLYGRAHPRPRLVAARRTSHPRLR